MNVKQKLVLQQQKGTVRSLLEIHFCICILHFFQQVYLISDLRIYAAKTV